MSSPIPRRPQATVEDAIRIAEAMNIDPTPWEHIRPSTYETFRFWQECLFADADVAWQWQPQSSATPQPKATLEANSTVLSTVPTAASATSSDEAANECGICREELVGKEADAPVAIRLSACRHAVHKECMEGWLKVGSWTCPFCRAPVASERRADAEPRLEWETSLNEYWLEDLLERLPSPPAVEAQPMVGWW